MTVLRQAKIQLKTTDKFSGNLILMELNKFFNSNKTSNTLHLKNFSVFLTFPKMMLFTLDLITASDRSHNVLYFFCAFRIALVETFNFSLICIENASNNWFSSSSVHLLLQPKITRKCVQTCIVNKLNTSKH